MDTVCVRPRRYAGDMRAIVSLSRLRDNLLALGAGPGSIVDLRCDGYGHGAESIRDIAGRLGVTDFIGDGMEPSGTPIDPVRMLGCAPSGLHPVMELRGEVLQCKRLSPGEGVSYGLTYRAERDTAVALCTGGYAQGVVRSLGNRIEVRIGELSCPIVGRVAMDVCVAEVGTLGTREGEPVIYFGDEPAALLGWSAVTGEPPLSLTSVIGARVQREWVA